MSEIEVQRLTLDDWALERELRLAALQDAPTAFGSRYADAVLMSQTDWRERLVQQARFAAFRKGLAVGTVGCAPARDPYPTGATVLVGMWVAPPARGSGVADRLVAAITDLVGGRGGGAIWLSVTHGNVAAERLYARHGFHRVQGSGPAEERLFDMRLLLPGG